VTAALIGHPAFAAALAGGLLLGLVLLALRPRDRASVRNALIILGVAALTAVGASAAGESEAGGIAAEPRSSSPAWCCCGWR
jgi:hypothetical protein